MLAAFVRRKVNIMGWFSTATALKLGQGAYGNVKESLQGESDPFRTLSVALEKVEYEIVNGYYFPDKKAKARLAYWSRRIGRRLTMRAAELGDSAASQALSTPEVLSNQQAESTPAPIR